jgi:ketosteroid isomerase-like protein
MKKSGDKYTLAWEPQNGEVAISGELGYTWGLFTLSWMEDDGLEKKSYGKYLNIWKKSSSGSWKVVVDIGNSSPEPVE